MSTLLKSFLLVATLTQIPALAAESLSLDLERAVHVGAGCLASESERPLLVYRDGLLRVQSTGLGLLLGLGSSSELAARANCTVRIPYEVPAGSYLKSVSSRLAYGVYKTADARGAIAARVGTGHLSSQAQVAFEQGAAQDEYFLVKSFVGEAQSIEQACQSQKGILRVDLSTSGQLETAEDKLIIETILGEVKIYSRFELGACPSGQ